MAMRGADSPRRSRATEAICAKHAQMLGSQEFTVLFHGKLSRLYANSRLRPMKAETPKQTCPTFCRVGSKCAFSLSLSLSLTHTHAHIHTSKQP